MNARQELKQVEKAMGILRDLRKSPQVQESELLDKDLMLVYVKYGEWDLNSLWECGLTQMCICAKSHERRRVSRCFINYFS